MAGHAEFVKTVSEHGVIGSLVSLEDVTSGSKYGHVGIQKKITIKFDKDGHEHVFYSYDGSDIQIFKNARDDVKKGDHVVLEDLGGYCAAILVGA